LLGGVVLLIWPRFFNQPKPIACTQEAKLCSDGSYVGRVSPKCEFAPCPQTETVKLFYYNPGKDRGNDGNILCSRQGLAAVKREIPISENPIRDTLNLLLKGELTKEDKAQGITTEYPLIGLILKNSVLNNGALTLTFNDPNNKTVGGSCRVGILWFQIEATAKRFPEVKEVRFLPEELFQP